MRPGLTAILRQANHQGIAIMVCGIENQHKVARHEDVRLDTAVVVWQSSFRRLGPVCAVVAWLRSVDVFCFAISEVSNKMGVSGFWSYNRRLNQERRVLDVRLVPILVVLRNLNDWVLIGAWEVQRRAERRKFYEILDEAFKWMGQERRKENGSERPFA